MQFEQNSVPVPAYAAADQVARFFTRVYGWMFTGLMITALFSFLTITSETMMEMLFSSRWVFIGLLLAELGLVAWLSGLIGQLSPGMAMTVFTGYSALNGITLSVIFLVYTMSSITTVFLITAGMFGAMSLYGYTTKRSLDGLGSFCFMGLIGVLIAGLVNMFFENGMLSFVLSVAGVIVFTGLTAYDTRKLRTLAMSVTPGSEAAAVQSIQGALALYLDFVNLFLMLLRLLGRRR